jgi:uncharacterized protein (TIGR02145 family)
MERPTISHLSIVLIILVTIFSGCKKDKPISMPIVTTTPVSNLTTSTAVSGGSITSDGGSAITASGVCWSISENPTIDNNVTSDNSSEGEFVSFLTGLQPVTTFYLRAYATNSLGTAYGKEIHFTTTSTATAVYDIDGNIYSYKKIGIQVWLQENLKTTKYRNGDLIGTTNPASEDISGEITSEYQWAFNGTESNVPLYGRLYTWYVVNDNRGICPTGWHVPSDAEWTTLTSYLIDNLYGYGDSGNLIAKALAATSGWTPDLTSGNVGNDQGSNNYSGFSGLPAGTRSRVGRFLGTGSNTFWWASTEKDASDAGVLYIYYGGGEVTRGSFSKQYGFSVRCLQDEE